MMSNLKKRLSILAFLVLFALPLVWYCGTTWNSNADDLITTLISLENWTFFFWQQSRFGTFVMLLAKPFTDMRSNLLFQNFLHAFSLIIFIYAVSRVFYQNQKNEKSRTFTYISLILIFLLSNLVYLKLLISGIPYAEPLGLFGISLLLVNSNLKRIIVLPSIIALIATSCWINPLNGYYLAPLLILFLSLKKFKNVFYELALSYLLVNFGFFFIILGVANGEQGGIVPPNFLPFKIYNWWLPLIIIQLLLVSQAIYRRQFKINQFTYYGFFLTWISVYALTTLRHIYVNSEATRYFITAVFVSMCLTMRPLEELISESRILEGKISKLLNLLSKKKVLAGSLLLLLLANFFIARNLVSDYPLRQPQKKLLSSIFKNNSDSYRFASGDFWYAWPTKLYVSKPEDIFVTALRSQFQYDPSTETKKEIRARLKSGDVGLCFGEVKKCERELRSSVLKMYASLNYQVDVTDLGQIVDSPILVHKLRLEITSKKILNYALS